MIVTPRIQSAYTLTAPPPILSLFLSLSRTHTNTTPTPNTKSTTTAAPPHPVQAGGLHASVCRAPQPTQSGLQAAVGHGHPGAGFRQWGGWVRECVCVRACGGGYSLFGGEEWHRIDLFPSWWPAMPFSSQFNHPIHSTPWRSYPRSTILPINQSHTHEQVSRSFTVAPVHASLILHFQDRDGALPACTIRMLMHVRG